MIIGNIAHRVILFSKHEFQADAPPFIVPVMSNIVFSSEKMRFVVFYSQNCRTERIGVVIGNTILDLLKIQELFDGRLTEEFQVMFHSRDSEEVYYNPSSILK